jgi:hypothetical protein
MSVGDSSLAWDLSPDAGLRFRVPKGSTGRVAVKTSGSPSVGRCLSLLFGPAFGSSLSCWSWGGSCVSSVVISICGTAGLAEGTSYLGWVSVVVYGFSILHWVGSV